MSGNIEVEVAEVRRLNDLLRTTGQGGQFIVTAGIAALGAAFVQEALMLVMRFEEFGPDNDPHGEHDFGNFTLAGETVYFKIDYYDAEMAMGSPNPADPSVTTRVLTVLLAGEW